MFSVPKTGTKAHSPKLPFYETALLFPLEFSPVPEEAKGALGQESRFTEFRGCWGLFLIFPRKSTKCKCSKFAVGGGVRIWQWFLESFRVPDSIWKIIISLELQAGSTAESHWIGGQTSGQTWFAPLCQARQVSRPVSRQMLTERPKLRLFSIWGLRGQFVAKEKNQEGWQRAGAQKGGFANALFNLQNPWNPLKRPWLWSEGFSSIFQAFFMAIPWKVHENYLKNAWKTLDLKITVFSEGFQIPLLCPRKNEEAFKLLGKALQAVLETIWFTCAFLSRESCSRVSIRHLPSACARWAISGAHPPPEF